MRTPRSRLCWESLSDLPPLAAAYGIGLALLLLVLASGSLLADDWPQWRGPRRDGVWRESGLLQAFDKPQLSIKWRAEIASGYCGPTVADGRVFVMDRLVEPKEIERVHCFDANSGQEIWSHAYEQS